MTNKRVLICGDRFWTDIGKIELEIFLRLEPGDIVIHGGARGADSIAAEISESYGLKVLPFLANWNKFGKAAGPIRNQQMLDDGNPDEVWAFHSDLANSKGTKDMVSRASKAGKLIRLFD
jgi:hypothetical protein